MKQVSFADAEYLGKCKQTRRETFRAEMEAVVPWESLLGLIEPVYPKAGKGWPPYALSAMLRIHLMQNWFGYSDPGMEEALYEVTSMRRFAGLSRTHDRLPDETTILNFRHFLEQHNLASKLFAAINEYLTAKNLMLRNGTMVDATIIHAPPSTTRTRPKRAIRRCTRRRRATSGTSA